MNCWHCNTKLIWGGDHDIKEENEDFIRETNLSCPNCKTFVLVYLPKEEKNEPIKN
jgi:RNase P subunit RPR2